MPGARGSASTFTSYPVGVGVGVGVGVAPPGTGWSSTTILVLVLSTRTAYTFSPRTPTKSMLPDRGWLPISRWLSRL